MVSIPCLMVLCLPNASAEVDFNSQVRPILSDKCFFCHGPDKNTREADLRLDLADGAYRNDDGIRPVVPGKPEESEIIHRIFSSDPDELMPPPESNKFLTPEEKVILKQWIAEGGQYDVHWAYSFQPPTIKTKIDKPLSPPEIIDFLVEKKLGSVGMQLSDEADAVTLWRRVHFDLTGLPAEPMASSSLKYMMSEEYESVLNDLLGRRGFGERLAIYWLDLVRYADTVGYHGDQTHNIAPYRDYVIDAFNQNMPLDQFSREQLAGDLLPSSTIDQKIATGYNRLLQTSHEGGVQAKEYLAIYAADRVRNFSNVWMGATVGCAQCHDHKYDPYTAKDFYAMSAFFADIDEAQHFKVGSNALPTRRPPEMDVVPISTRRQIDTLNELLRAPEFSQEEKSRMRAKLDELSNIKIKTMVTESIEPRVTRIFPRGNWLDDSGPEVQPAIPEFMGKLKSSGDRATRLDLANWLFTPLEAGGSGELTARVFANRIWYLLFGRGISPSLDDFGGQGVPPSQPELLNFLAQHLIENDWDIKNLMKTIMLTRTYRQTSEPDSEALEADPDNRFFARQSRFRVAAEMVRDTALKLSGLLVEDISPFTSRPYQPDGYYRHLNFPVRKYSASEDRNQWRRGVYVHWQRQFLHPMLKAFDAPSREECTARRPQSNTPLSSLVLLNDPAFVEAGRSFAQRSFKELPEAGDEARIRWMWMQATSRIPDHSGETTLLKSLLKESRAFFEMHPKKAASVKSIGMAPSTEPIQPVELASWTQIARAILNLNETYQRN